MPFVCRTRLIKMFLVVEMLTRYVGRDRGGVLEYCDVF